MAYNFYFDEIFHDAKITIYNERVNIFRDSSKDLFNDSYIGLFWGEKASDYINNKELIESFEEKYRNIFSIENDKEFKSQVIKKDKFLKGLNTLDKNAYNFYSDLFDLMEEISPLIQINSISKCELLIRNIFDLNQIKKLGGKPNSFVYTLTKFIRTYNNSELEQSFFEATKGDVIGLQATLLRFIEYLITYIETNSIQRKSKEIKTLHDLDFLLKAYDFERDSISDRYDFVYKEIFEGIQDYLYEKKIANKKVNLYIDRYSSIIEASKGYSFRKIIPLDSEQSINIRFADFLCGFYGKMMWALTMDDSLYEKYEEIGKINISELKQKHLLSADWFNIDLKTYNLYIKAYKQLVVKQEAYWAARTWSYSDQVVMFYSLLRYFASYETYEKYKAVSLDNHREYYNTACCLELERYYSNVL